MNDRIKKVLPLIIIAGVLIISIPLVFFNKSETRNWQETDREERGKPATSDTVNSAPMKETSKASKSDEAKQPAKDAQKRKEDLEISIQLADLGTANPRAIEAAIAWPMAGDDDSAKIGRTFPSRIKWGEKPLYRDEGNPRAYRQDEIPLRDMYIVMAWTPYGEYSVHKVSRDPEQYSIKLDDMTMNSPTALEINLLGELEGHDSFFLRLVRTREGENSVNGEAWRYFLWRSRPKMLELYDWPPAEEFDAPREMMTDSDVVPLSETIKLPILIPDSSVEVQLATRTGVAGRPITVTLDKGTTKRIDVQLSEIFPQEIKPCLVVRGLLVDESGNPIHDARVIWVDKELAYYERTTNLEGMFEFDCLPAQSAHLHDKKVQQDETFHGHGNSRARQKQSADIEDNTIMNQLWDSPVVTTIRAIIPGKGGLGQREITYDIKESHIQDSVAEIEWAVDSLHTLAVDLTPELDQEIRQESSARFPVQFLYLYDSKKNQWIVQPSTKLNYTENGFRLGYRPNEYSKARVGIAVNPLKAYFTTEVDITVNDEKETLQLAVSEIPTRPFRIKVLNELNGEPLNGILVKANGLTFYDAFQEVTTDEGGVALFEEVNLNKFLLEFNIGEQIIRGGVRRTSDEVIVNLNLSDATMSLVDPNNTTSTDQL